MYSIGQLGSDHIARIIAKPFSRHEGGNVKTRTLGLCAILWILWTVDSALACKTGWRSNTEMVAGAELILRASAVDYAVQPIGTGRTTGVSDSRIRFRVESVLKGTYGSQDLLLPGYLSNKDDWNDQPSPYSMVRTNGRSGSCFANTYRQGAQFLLVLKRTGGVATVFSSDTEYTVNWYALGPVNEQLRSPEDPWLKWVSEQVNAR
jgi:hypothetical protein